VVSFFAALDFEGGVLFNLPGGVDCAVVCVYPRVGRRIAGVIMVGVSIDAESSAEIFRF